MAQDTGLGLPRLGGALAGPRAAARRLGGGASAGARGGGDDESQVKPTPLPPGDGTPDRKASLWMGGGLVLLLSTPLMSLPPVFEDHRLVF